MMRDAIRWSVVTLIIGGIIAACMTFRHIGYLDGIRHMRREACKQGFADYDADENGDSQFIWAVPFGEVK